MEDTYEIGDITGYCPEYDEEVTIQVTYIVHVNTRILSSMKCKYASFSQKCSYAAPNKKCPILIAAGI
jgi:hypothetical protein